MERSIQDEYQILTTIGTGTYAQVYKARHRQLGYIRALRVMNQTVVNERDNFYVSFLEECKLLLRLGNGSHSNIVHIAQPRLIGMNALVEMEFIDGIDLYDHLVNDHKRFMPMHEVLKLVKDISSALSYCHYDVYNFCIDPEEDKCVDTESIPFRMTPECVQDLVKKYKVIHNDIHSKNIIRKYDGNYILLDFGLAVISGEVVRKSKSQGGAPEYKPPEKWTDNDLISEQSDIYSFGILLYEALTGEVPFPLINQNNFDELNKLRSRHQGEIPAPIFDKRKAAFEALRQNKGQAYKQDYPEWLAAIVMKCLKKDPALRFANGKVLNDHLKECLKADENGPKLDGLLDEALARLKEIEKELELSKIQATYLREANNALTLKNHEMQMLVDERDRKIIGQGQEIMDLIVRAEAFAGELDRYKNELNRLGSENEQFKNSNNSLLSENQQLSKTNESLSIEADRLNTLSKSQQLMLSKANDEIASLKELLLREDQQKNSANKSLIMENDRLITLSKSQQLMVSKANDEIEKLKKENKRLIERGPVSDGGKKGPAEKIIIAILLIVLGYVGWQLWTMPMSLEKANKIVATAKEHIDGPYTINNGEINALKNVIKTFPQKKDTIIMLFARKAVRSGTYQQNVKELFDNDQVKTITARKLRALHLSDYYGDVKNDSPNGIGISTNLDGTICIGSWINGINVGNGICHSP